MNELIKIIETDGKKAVSARELYEKLGFDLSQWARWFKKNIKNNQFAIESEDYTQLDTMSRTVDFALSINFAKKLSMMARTETGEKIRQYFIDVENRSQTPVHAIPQSYAEALEFAAKQQRMLDTSTKEIAILTPKAEFVDRAIKCDELTEISMACKVLDLPYGRNTLYAVLRKSGTFFKNRNEPAQHLVTMGFFKIKQRIIKRKVHPDVIVNVPFITEKGLVRLYGWLKERNFLDKKNVQKYLLNPE